MNSNKKWMVFSIVGALLSIALSGARAQPTADTPEVFSVTTSDDITVNVQRWGNPDGREILFIHGLSQSHLSRSEQVTSPLLADYDMVTYDVRGHGGSQKVLDAEYYEGEDLALELRAVVEAAGFERPVLVGWSYAGRIIAEYLSRFGDTDISGIVIVGGLSRGGEGSFGPGAQVAGGTTSTNLAVNVQSTIAFVKMMTAQPMSEVLFETTLAYNMMTPPEVRLNLLSGLPTGEDYDSIWDAVRVPFLVIQGTEDQVILMSTAEYLADAVPGAELSVYEGIGHAPFLEAPERFNQQLIAFVEDAHN
jgi:pimeloyl-ACP methyl ester carboxylesterase